MSTQHYPTQTNTQSGSFVTLAAEDLTDKEGYLVKPVADSGQLKVRLPEAATDATLPCAQWRC